MDALLLNSLCGKTIQQVEWDAEDKKWINIKFTDGSTISIDADADYGNWWLEIKELS